MKGNTKLRSLIKQKEAKKPQTIMQQQTKIMEQKLLQLKQQMESVEMNRSSGGWKTTRDKHTPLPKVNNFTQLLKEHKTTKQQSLQSTAEMKSSRVSEVAVESVDTFLLKTNLTQYAQVFQDHFVTSLADLMNVDNDFLAENKVSIGHRIKMLKEIDKMRKAQEELDRQKAQVEMDTKPIMILLDEEDAFDHLIFSNYNQGTAVRQPEEEEEEEEDKGNVWEGEYDEEKQKEEFQKAVNEFRNQMNIMSESQVAFRKGETVKQEEEKKKESIYTFQEKIALLRTEKKQYGNCWQCLAKIFLEDLKVEQRLFCKQTCLDMFNLSFTQNCFRQGCDALFM